MDKSFQTAIPALIAHLEDIDVPGWLSAKALCCEAVGLSQLVHDVALLFGCVRQAAPLLGRACKVSQLRLHGLHLVPVVPRIVHQLRRPVDVPASTGEAPQ